MSLARGSASAGSASEARCAASAIAAVGDAGAGLAAPRADAAPREDFGAVAAALFSLVADVAAVFFAALVVFLAAGVRVVFLTAGADGSDAFA
jgi:hypothetical protein